MYSPKSKLDQLRNRKVSIDLEGGAATESALQQHRIAELEQLVGSLRHMLDKSRSREKKLVAALSDRGGSIDLEDNDDALRIASVAGQAAFKDEFVERASWLIGLLIFQSCSSFILASNEQLLQNHPVIVYYLTMLIGSGGNAGNQATVKVIRELAIGALKSRNRNNFIVYEVLMAVTLSAAVGLAGVLRVLIFGDLLWVEIFTILFALVTIVFSSIIIGTLLPLAYHYFGIDPANSSTSIQVIMDIMGVVLTCFVASVALDGGVFGGSDAAPLVDAVAAVAGDASAGDSLKASAEAAASALAAAAGASNTPP